MFMDIIFIRHIMDLSSKAEREYVFTYTPFLNADEQSEIEFNKNSLAVYSFWGGVEGTERNICRFGNPDELFYEEDFPLSLLKISPSNPKFSDELTHRDYLGAVMSLGIERENIGDIIIRNKDAYIFVLNKMSEYICSNLTNVKHTTVITSCCENLPDGGLIKTEEKRIISTSMRCDCIISSVYNLSRNSANQLFDAKKVYINSRQTENKSYTIKCGDVISVRGFGKFRIKEITGETKKGREIISAEIFR